MKPKPRTVIIEQLSGINCKDLGNKRGSYTIDLSLRLPQIVCAKISRGCVAFHHRSLHRNTPGDIQSFQLKPIKSGFGYRYVFICNCNTAVQSLYYHAGRLCCRWCIPHALYASQTSSKRQRQVLQISRIESLLGDKRYSTYRRVRERLERKLGAKVMLAKALRG